MKARVTTEPIDRIVSPIHSFAEHKLSGAVLLLLSTAVALLWANSPWSHLYETLLATPVTVGAGELALSKPLLLWINDGLMGIFFFVVGLEIKRELLSGDLSTLRLALLPVAAALGGMVVPALVYTAFNTDTPGAVGWGIPMATDIAFALGVLSMLRVPVGLKVFLTALAIVDDIGAIVVIAAFYTDAVALQSLAIGGALLMVSIAANALGVRSPFVYFLLGTLVWLAFLKSGVHATLAAVLMAMTIPARARLQGPSFVVRAGQILDEIEAARLPSRRTLLSRRQHDLLEEMSQLSGEATAPLQRLEHRLVGAVTFLVLPIFALANAGVTFDGQPLDAIRQPVALGVIFGLLVGKPVGIATFSWIAVRLGWADLPEGVTWRQLLGVGCLAGIGFTMSLFVGALAFADPDFQRVAKLGILVGSTVSAIAGVALLQSASRTAIAASPGRLAVPVRSSPGSAGS